MIHPQAMDHRISESATCSSLLPPLATMSLYTQSLMDQVRWKAQGMIGMILEGRKKRFETFQLLAEP